MKNTKIFLLILSYDEELWISANSNQEVAISDIMWQRLWEQVVEGETEDKGAKEKEREEGEGKTQENDG